MPLALTSTRTAKLAPSKPLDSESESASTASTTESSSKANVCASQVSSKEPTASALLAVLDAKVARVPLPAQLAPLGLHPTETAVVPADPEPFWFPSQPVSTANLATSTAPRARCLPPTALPAKPASPSRPPATPASATRELTSPPTALSASAASATVSAVPTPPSAPTAPPVTSTTPQSSSVLSTAPTANSTPAPSARLVLPDASAATPSPSALPACQASACSLAHVGPSVLKEPTHQTANVTLATLNANPALVPLSAPVALASSCSSPTSVFPTVNLVLSTPMAVAVLATWLRV